MTYVYCMTTPPPVSPGVIRLLLLDQGGLCRQKSPAETMSSTLCTCRTPIGLCMARPSQVLHKLNHQVFIVESVAVEHVRSFAVQCLHRFASSDLGNTEQIWMDIARDHRDNVIQKLTGHRFDDDLWFKVRWIGFTATRDTWQRVIVLAASCPDRVLQYYRQPCARRTPERVTFVQREFPTADYNVTLFQSVTVTRQRDFPTRMRRRTRKNFEFL